MKYISYQRITYQYVYEYRGNENQLTSLVISLSRALARILKKDIFNLSKEQILKHMLKSLITSFRAEDIAKGLNHSDDGRRLFECSTSLDLLRGLDDLPLSRSSSRSGSRSLCL